MNDIPSEHHRAHAAHIVVRPPVMDERPPYRRVEILGTVVGKAYGLQDVTEFARRAGLEDVDLANDESVRWEGGGPGFWGTDTGV
ncbi:MAG TPA: hypothetical protein VH092_18880 [Urbifossiella sp.]|jgi:hypothetical protein|nr:hypothetical protein [Urbifossiella sp.]